MSQSSFFELLMQDRRALSVSELTAQIKIRLEGEFIDVWVEGEISNFRPHSSGHWYFTLKDEGAMLRCASFRMQNRLIRFRPEDGLSVRARGRISLYETRGEYQLLVEYLEPVGIGALQLAFEQLKAQLEAEGLFDAERKRPLPLLPHCVGVVTSPTGAALRDILRVIGRRNEAVNVLIAPARVQGDGAAQEIARAIELLNQQADVEVIIVGRGGGSMEDLWAFNEEVVARANYPSRAPIISAVGHETDFTIADFVADRRASTPSAAAEMVAFARDEAIAMIHGLREAMGQAMRYQLLMRRHELQALHRHPAFHQLAGRIHSLRQDIDATAYALTAAMTKRLRRADAVQQAAARQLRELDLRRVLTQRRGQFQVLGTQLTAAARALLRRHSEPLVIAASKLDSLSPLRVLGRGYAIAFDSEGRIIKRAAQVGIGERVRVRLATDEFTCTKD